MLPKAFLSHFPNVLSYFYVIENAIFLPGVLQNASDVFWRKLYNKLSGRKINDLDSFLGIKYTSKKLLEFALKTLNTSNRDFHGFGTTKC